MAATKEFTERPTFFIGFGSTTNPVKIYAEKPPIFEHRDTSNKSVPTLKPCTGILSLQRHHFLRDGTVLTTGHSTTSLAFTMNAHILEQYSNLKMDLESEKITKRYIDASETLWVD